MTVNEMTLKGIADRLRAASDEAAATASEDLRKGDREIATMHLLESKIYMEVANSILSELIGK